MGFSASGIQILQPFHFHTGSPFLLPQRANRSHSRQYVPQSLRTGEDFLPLKCPENVLPNSGSRLQAPGTNIFLTRIRPALSVQLSISRFCVRGSFLPSKSKFCQQMFRFSVQAFSESETNEQEG